MKVLIHFVSGQSVRLEVEGVDTLFEAFSALQEHPARDYAGGAVLVNLPNVETMREIVE